MKMKVSLTKALGLAVLIASVFVIDSCDNDDSEPAIVPIITTFSPTEGTEGATVMITGENFSTVMNENIVSFNGTVASVTEATATTLTVAVPAGATTGKISVQVGNQATTSTADFEVLTIPTVTSFSPTSGTEGTTVTITGTNFNTVMSENVVMFNGTAAAITEATSTTLTVTVPAGASTGKITVKVGTLETTSTTDFEILAIPTIASFSPTTGNEGTTVEITGTNFSTVMSENTVMFNGTAAIVTEATATKLTAIVPAGTTTGKITVQVGTPIVTSTDDFVIQ